MFHLDGCLNGDPSEFYDERFDAGDDGGGYTPHAYKQDDRAEYTVNRWHHHHKVEVAIVRQTEKAYLLKDAKGQYWIPKALVHMGEKTTYQYRHFEVKYIAPDIISDDFKARVFQKGSKQCQ